MSESDFMKAWEVAEMLGVETSWVWRKWEAGQLPGFRLPASNRLRFYRHEILEVMERRRGGFDVDPGAQLPFPR